jgi:hypothetical protein
MAMMRCEDREAHDPGAADVVEEVRRREVCDVAPGPRLEVPAAGCEPDLLEADVATPLLPSGIGHPVTVRNVPDLGVDDRGVIEREVEGRAGEREASRRQEDPS